MARGDRSPETRDTLLGAGAQVFVRRGLYGATVREIVAEAGLTAPALYYHFEGKEDLYDQLIGAGSERFRSMVEEAIGSASDPEAALRGIARAYIRFAEEDRTRLRVFFAELFQPDGGRDGARALDEVRDWTRERVTETLRQLSAGSEHAIPDPVAASRLFLATLAGLLVEQARRPGEALLDEALAVETVRVFLWGIGGAKESR